MADWPTSLPQEFIENSFSMTLIDNLIRTNMDYGPAKVRRRTTSNVQKFQGMMLFNNTELSTFTSFYNNNLSYGSTSFNWVDPMSGSNATVRFTEPPKLTPAGGEYTEVQMSLEKLV